jgi:hypothetical protein
MATENQGPQGDQHLNVFRLRRTAETEAKKTPHRIIPRLVSRGNHSYIFLVENGPSDIIDFQLQFTNSDAKIVLDADTWSNKIVWPKLLGGQSIEKHFCIGVNDPYEYEAEWSWVSADGIKHQEKAIILVELKNAPSSSPTRSAFDDIQY